MEIHDFCSRSGEPLYFYKILEYESSSIFYSSTAYPKEEVESWAKDYHDSLSTRNFVASSPDLSDEELDKEYYTWYDNQSWKKKFHEKFPNMRLLTNEDFTAVGFVGM